MSYCSIIIHIRSLLFRLFTGVGVLTAILVFSGLLTGCVEDKEEGELSLDAGSRMPEFSVTLMDGEVFSTDNLTNSGISNLLILFFNTECQDCQQKLPEIQTLYDRILKDEKLAKQTRIICIAREEGAEEVRSFWETHNLTLPVSPQSDRKIYNLFANIGIPRLYLINTSTSTVRAAWSPTNISIEEVFSQLQK
ncbi:MAG: TlpA family protein disulfide reductase [Muribaculaceae bacterium]|nr:TlpA family protein disulfide reductase [Muribaculaceae bacterium]